MKKIPLVLICVVLALGCARVRLEGSKEQPIKIDVSMRLDIYQHIQNDIDAIEGIVSGSQTNPPAEEHQSKLNFFIASAYAQDELSPEVTAAALRRKQRLASLQPLMASGAIGENKSGLLEIRNAGALDASAQTMVSQENSDRALIYQALAEKNNSSVSEIQKLYAARLQSDAPGGTPIETHTQNESFAWQKK